MPKSQKLKKGSKGFWCKCKLSKKVPFCDGSHKGSGIKPLQYVAEQDSEFIVCTCMRSKNFPFCDGSHNS